MQKVTSTLTKGNESLVKIFQDIIDEGNEIQQVVPILHNHYIIIYNEIEKGNF